MLRILATRVANGLIKHVTSARRVAPFARGSAGPGSPAPLFTALARGGSLSLREAVPVRRGGSLSLREAVPALGPRPHYLRHFDEGPAGVANGTIKHVTFAKWDATFSIVSRIPGGNDTIPR